MAFRNGLLISRFCKHPCHYSVVKDPCLQLKLPGAFGATKLYTLMIPERVKKSIVSRRVKQFEPITSQLTITTGNPDQVGLGSGALESAKPTEEPQSSKSAKQTEEPQSSKLAEQTEEPQSHQKVDLLDVTKAADDTVIGIIQ
jgi:hypothetical protein